MRRQVAPKQKRPQRPHAVGHLALARRRRDAHDKGLARQARDVVLLHRHDARRKVPAERLRGEPIGDLLGGARLRAEEDEERAVWHFSRSSAAVMKVHTHERSL